MVDADPTQRDQFNNDDVDLAEALVRESIQNSLDAVQDNNKPVRLRYSTLELRDGEHDRFKRYFDGLVPHLKACDINFSPAQRKFSRVLLIEDFNTHGLTGKTDDLDEGHFRNFWRRHGRSSKGQTKGGRWGLGKLVYSSSSESRSFFGLTVTKKGGANLFAQTVLENHSIHGKRHHSHGFWYSECTYIDEDELQLPVTDDAIIKDFSTLAGFSRKNDPGLSIAVPYFVAENIDEDKILDAVLRNYFFPILGDRLEVTVNDKLVNKSTFMDHVNSRKWKDPIPWHLISEILEKRKDAVHFLAEKLNPRKERLSEESFAPETLREMKEKYKQEELVEVRVPIELTRKNRTTETGTIELYLHSLIGSRFALVTRGPLMLGTEAARFNGSSVFSAMIAFDPVISEFLGDAENPSHTAWNSNAEKLTKKWINARDSLRVVRHAFQELYDIVAEVPDVEDIDALRPFFSVSEKSAKNEPEVVLPPIPPHSERLIVITKLSSGGGFSITLSDRVSDDDFPLRLRVEMAYDTLGRNPFRAYHPLDFELNKDISVVCECGEVSEVGMNKLQVFIPRECARTFKLSCKNFDKNRDVVVRSFVVESVHA